jgi:FPC/CPF motif-containing protein YcgG
MFKVEIDPVVEEFQRFISDDTYPCVAARAALSRQQIKFLVADHMACPKDDNRILQFVYEFVEHYRASKTTLHSAAVIFRQPGMTTEEMFDSFLWQRLQSLATMDAENFSYDKRVSSEPMSSDFSFSLAEEAFFIIGMHPGSSRPARRFRYPALIFNPHAQFDELRTLDRYEKMKNIVRKRDILFSGSINPMLSDYGNTSEALQYSGRHYGSEWTCPLKTMHGTIKDNSAPE